MSRPSTRRVRLSLREIGAAVALSAMAGGAALGAAVVLGQLLFDDLADLPPPEIAASEP